MRSVPVGPGNVVEVLLNGDQTYPRLWEDQPRLLARQRAVAGAGILRLRRARSGGDTADVLADGKHRGGGAPS